MISPDDLRNYVAAMRDLGVTAFKHDGLEIALGTEPAKPLAPRDPDAPALPRKNDYEKLLFAATEGLPEDDE